MDPAMLKLGHYKNDQRKFWQYVDRGIDDILCKCNRVLSLFADDKFQPFKSFFSFLDFYFYFFYLYLFFGSRLSWYLFFIGNFLPHFDCAPNPI